MDVMKRFEPLFLLLVVLGALNWLVLALFNTNVVTEIVGSGTASDVVYVVIGVAGITMLPRLMDGLHLGGHDVRPHGA